MRLRLLRLWLRLLQVLAHGRSHVLLLLLRANLWTNKCTLNTSEYQWNRFFFRSLSMSYVLNAIDSHRLPCCGAPSPSRRQTARRRVAYLLRNGILHPNLLRLRRHIVLLLRVRGRRLLDNGCGIGLSAGRLRHLGVVLLQIGRFDLLLVLGEHGAAGQQQ